ncbi:MAG: hypothetical protein FJ217_15875 [Ignavibacteria bacterium]|nr:hypothetical protein [Ignavibacteria bacterium]
MRINYVESILVPLIPWALRFPLYWIAFKVRSIHIRVLSCLIIAGVSYFFDIIPLRLPEEMHFVVSVALAAFLITRYTEAELFPDALMIPFIVELISLLFLSYVITPLLN